MSDRSFGDFLRSCASHPARDRNSSGQCLVFPEEISAWATRVDEIEAERDRLLMERDQAILRLHTIETNFRKLAALEGGDDE